MSTLRAKKIETEMKSEKGEHLIKEDDDNEDEGEAFLDTSDTDFKGHPRVKRKKKIESFKSNSSSLYKGQLMAASMIACCLNMAFMETVLR